MERGRKPKAGPTLVTFVLWGVLASVPDKAYERSNSYCREHGIGFHDFMDEPLSFIDYH